MSRRRNLIGKIVHRQRETSREEGWMYFVSLFSICTRSDDKRRIKMYKRRNHLGEENKDTERNNECHVQSMPESRNAFCSRVSLTAANTNRIYTMEKREIINKPNAFLIYFFLVLLTLEVLVA